MSEVWKPIYGFEGYYEVSSLGRVRRIKTGKGARVTGFRRIHSYRGGYYGVPLYKDKKPTLVMIHRMIAAAFIGPCPPGYEVNHKNGVRTDNRVENLEYVTHAENIQHAVRTLKKQLGQPKLTETDVLAIRKRAAAGERERDIANDYCVTDGCIRHLVDGHTWKHLPYKKKKRKRANEKFSEADVREIRRLYATGIPKLRLARQYDTTDRNIFCIVNRLTWAHVE